jgi:ferrochelatase
VNRFKGQKDFHHGRQPITGILVVNLGTPDDPTPSSVRRYLAEFLSDKRVVEIPYLIWKMILHGIVLRVRPKKSAAAYQRVWSDKGSPLMAGSAGLTDGITAQLKSHYGDRVQTRLAMRYGNPSIRDGLNELQKAGAERIIVLPLYPQYSGATSGTVADEVFRQLMKWRWIPELHLLGPYHDDPAFLAAVADSVEQHWQQKGRGDKLVMSFHGMPRATLDQGDPYFCHCHKTARLLAEKLQLTDGEWEMAFQSRFGAAEWLKPYAAERWKALPAEGTKHLKVICPGFSIDCLETIDEIALEGKEEFIEAGGESFDYIHCLNDSAAHVNYMVNRLRPIIDAGASDEDDQHRQQALAKSREFAIAAGAPG